MRCLWKTFKMPIYEIAPEHRRMRQFSPKSRRVVKSSVVLQTNGVESNFLLSRKLLVKRKQIFIRFEVGVSLSYPVFVHSGEPDF